MYSPVLYVLEKYINLSIFPERRHIFKLMSFVFSRSSSFDIVRELNEKGFIGVLRQKTDRRRKTYFLTYRGRKFLYDKGDMNQLKYLNL